MKIGETIDVAWYAGRPEQVMVEGTVSALPDSLTVRPGHVRVRHTKQQLRQAGLSGCGGVWTFPLSQIQGIDC